MANYAVRPPSSRLHSQRLAASSTLARRRPSMATVAAVQSPLPPTSRHSKKRGLVRVLLDQARREVWGGWLSDLVLPLVSDDTGSREPPPVTRPPRELAEPGSKFLKVDGVTLHYKQCFPSSAVDPVGPPAAGGGAAAVSTGAQGASSSSGSTGQWQQRPAVLLMHGYNGSVFSWRDTMQAVADRTGCRVIAFDRPPFGLAERPLSWGGKGQRLQYNPYRPEGSARLAAGLLDALGARSVVAVGHSAGALVCMELALLQPWRIAGLGFVAPALPTTPDQGFARRANLGQQLRLLLTRGLLANDTLGLRYVRRQILRRRDEVAAGKLGVLSDESNVPQDVIEGYLKPLQADNWDRGTLLNLRAFSIPPSYDYDTLKHPVLLVQGSNDGSLTRNAHQLSKLLEQRPSGSTQFIELQGVGHVPMDECPQQLNTLLADFVRQVAAVTPAVAA